MENEIKQKIDATLQNLQELPAMPAVVIKAVHMASDPNADFKQLADEISKDPAITANVIRLSNSAYYRPTRQVRSIQEAIKALGLKTVKDIIVIAATKKLLNVPLDGYKMEGADLWDHSLVVAELASRITKLKKAGPPDVAFTAGLLHDIGKLVLQNYFRRIYRLVTMEMENNPEARFTDMEKQFMGYSHPEIGSKLLRIWNFPEELSEAVEHSYSPEKATINPNLTSAVHIANEIALSAGIGVDMGGLSEPLSKFALEKLKLQEEDIKTFYDQLPELMTEIQDLRSI